MSRILARREGFVISDDPDLIQVDVVHGFLTRESYWRPGVTREVVQRAMAASLCLGVYTDDEAMVGFARVVSDTVTYAWLDDVFIISAYRGQGLGDWLIGIALAHPDVADVAAIMLLTADAQQLYGRHGFQEFSGWESVMIRTKPEPTD
ncbi:GNAT family N-acetyltransferase [Actinomadura napierensis]|uniref:GNAT family N-acetyltransferase n=1 Tax=Actinomadura napierensis TaxID=267854 RepID=UPI0031CE03EE